MIFFPLVSFFSAYFYNFFNILFLFLNLFLAVLGSFLLHGLFSSCGVGLFFTAGCRLLLAVASLVEQRLEGTEASVAVPHRLCCVVPRLQSTDSAAWRTGLVPLSPCGSFLDWD